MIRIIAEDVDGLPKGAGFAQLGVRLFDPECPSRTIDVSAASLDDPVNIDEGMSCTDSSLAERLA